MRNIIIKKGLVIGIIILFIGMSVSSSTGSIRENHEIEIEKNIETPYEEINPINNDAEYWALLVAVGVYAGHPEEDRPSMLKGVEFLYDKLLVSTHWKKDNINVIKGENATLWNIFKGFRWLNQKESEGDFSLVYITTHGGQLTKDIWPRDEYDGLDEILASYRGFQLPFTNIRDDILNLLLSLFSSKGVCVIIDSCYAGGFNDTPFFTDFMRNKKDLSLRNSRVNSSSWMQEMGNDLRGEGRVVLMSCQEDELTASNVFTPLLIESLTGYADTNEDKIVTAEEAFTYIEDNIDPMFRMHPTIFDNFPGELPLTEVEYPPSVPETPIGQIIGETNTTYNYSTVSIDPEGLKIKYGWDLDGDNIVDEWSGFLNSGIWHNISRSWSVEGTYNIKVKAVDERGVESVWSNDTAVSMSSDHISDQRHTNIGGGTFLINQWIAQSFVPSLDTLSKIEVLLENWKSGDAPPLQFYIRDDLSGDNIAESSRVIPKTGDGKYTWFTFDFEDIDVVPGETYYIVCEKVDPWPYIWRWSYDCYPHGKVFMSDDGINWSPFGHGGTSYDCCFVTWGSKI